MPRNGRPLVNVSRLRSTRAGLVLLFMAIAAPARADTMVINVNGVTIDDKGQPQRFAALQFVPDGKVKALFQSKDKRPKTDYQIDA